MYGVQTSDARGMRFWMFFRFQRFGLESLQFGQIRVISRLLVIGQEEGNMHMLLYVSFKCALLDHLGSYDFLYGIFLLLFLELLWS